jgi:hypothetical protein
MHTIRVNDCLAARWHALNKFLQIALWQGIPCLLNSRTNRVLPGNLLIVIVYPMLHPIPYALDRIQIRRVGRPFEDSDEAFGEFAERVF